MPIGVFVNMASVILGGLAGSALSARVTEKFKEKVNLVLGLSSMGMGLSSIVLMKNMPAVVFALILGTILGLLVRLEERINGAAKKVYRLLGQQGPDGDQGKTVEFVTAIVIFCASGTGIYGSLVAGMSGNHSILIAKSILDLFTAMIFACTLGLSVASIAVPQGVIFCALFYLAGLLVPLTTDAMFSDFKACGGMIMLATGLRMTKIKQFNVADMVPAMVFVMPFSWIWSNFILPLVG